MEPQRKSTPRSCPQASEPLTHIIHPRTRPGKLVRETGPLPNQSVIQPQRWSKQTPGGSAVVTTAVALFTDST